MRSLILAVLANLCLAVPTTRAEAPPSEQLLPAGSVFWLSIPDVPDFRERVDRTQFGRMTADPAMKLFMDHLEERITARWVETGGVANTINFDDLVDLPTGEFAFAVGQTSAGTSVVTAIVDITGQEAETEKLLNDLQTSLVNQGANRAVKAGFETIFTVYTNLPPPPAGEDDKILGLKRPDQFWHFIKNGVLVASTDGPTAVKIARDFASTEGKLGGEVPFQKVIERLEQDDRTGGRSPDVRGFLVPLGYLEIQRADFPNPERSRDDIDVLKVLKDEGFGAIDGVGAWLHLAEESADSLFRGAAYAPELPDGGVQILAFPNAPQPEPAPWVPQEASSWYGLHWDVSQAFESFGQVFDSAFDEEGGFADLVKSIEEDPQGPGINLRTDLVDLLEDQATVLGQVQDPVTITADQTLMAIPLKNVQLFQQNLRESVKGDPTVTQREEADVTVYEFRDNPAGRRDRRGAAAGPPLPPTLVAVSQGHLLVATQAEILSRVLTAEGKPSLGPDDPDFRRVTERLGEIAPEEVFLWGFVRTGDIVRGTHELVRQGKLRDAQTIYGTLLRELAGDAKTELKGDLLPPFDTVKHYFGTSGLYGHTEDGFGWFGEGFVLPPAAVPGVAGRP